MDNVIEAIKAIIEEIADIPSEDMEESSSMIDDLDLSSIEIMSIVSEIESKYSIKISENELLSISTIKELAEVVENKKST